MCCMVDQGSDICSQVLEQGAAPAGRTSRNLHKGGKPDLGFKDTVGFGEVGSIHPSWKEYMHSTTVYWVPTVRWGLGVQGLCGASQAEA